MVELLRLLFTIEEDFAFDPERQRRGLTLLLAADRALILVAEDGREVIGMATGQLLISTAEGAFSLNIEDVVIAPGHRGRGVGAALLDNLAGWGRKQGASRMQLLADRTNQPALGFYRRQEWQTTRLICLRKYNSRD
jgi:ribosomal protein S18 acetylase RimI-like enzyme